MSRAGVLCASFALLILAAPAGCARERGERDPKAAQPPPPYPMPPPNYPAPAPTPTTKRPVRAPSGPPSVDAPSAAGALPTKELFRAQDACLNQCDQFACMKIAEAYRSGAGLPADVLAGRRYAIHACLECGTPGLAIIDQCPAYGISAADLKKQQQK